MDQDMSPTVHAERERKTIALNKGLWSENAHANRPRIKNWVQSLWLDCGVKTGVLIAAGPSLEKSIEEIRALDRKTHEIVAVDMALEHLLDSGVMPDYVICADASAEIAATIDLPNAPRSAALLLSVTVRPETGAKWPGPVFWYCLASNVFDRDLGKWMQQDHAAASGVPSFLVPGGNVASLGLSFLLGVRAAPKVLLYGHDFCWTDDDRFYAGGVRAGLASERIRQETEAGTVFKVTSVSGAPVKTNGSLMQFASWFAERMTEYHGVIENRTPVTILREGGRQWT